MIPDKFLDQFGMVLPSGTGPGGASDNGILFSVQATLLGLDNKSQVVHPCFNSNSISRYPGGMSINSTDNIIAMTLLFPGSVYWNLKKYGWRTFTPDGKFDRRALLFSILPGTRGLCKWLLGKWCPVTRFFWNVGVMITMYSRRIQDDGQISTSDRLLVETTFLHPRAELLTYGWLRSAWRKRINKLFAEYSLENTTGEILMRSGLNVIVCAYFKDPEHPFRKIWK